ncbi:UNVERIFIED_CONTAM: hypothetical protein Scaly_2214600 [Sesamum calycinum]|uniref:DDE Tnp4 domain-containing protein n=1 Tax=Sesamum calycinum TaxID=2727403 RepID=A0AAW2MSS2_9LAMI
MASASEGAADETNSSSGTPGTPGTPGSTESDVPEEFYAFRDLICPELFREKVPRNTSALQGEGWDCVGAMDGTLVPAWVPQIDQNRYRSRKGRLAQNVLAICDFDMNFTYVYVGWEGKYYLVDAGFTNYQCFLAPYRGTRYHLAEYRGNDRRYRTPQDLFNHAHSRLRNVIERCFGVLKKRFPILQWGMPSYLLQHQVDLVIACCTLHNFIRKFNHDDIIFNEPEDDIPPDMDAFYHRGHPTVTEIEAQRTLRDNIAMQMWASYNPTYLERSGFPQEDHWTLSVEQRLMWMIVDDNTRDSMRDDHRAEAHMAHWARGLRRHFGYHYTREQLYPLARRYYQYPEPHYPSMLEIWGPLDCPLFQWRGRVMHAIARIVTSCVAMRECNKLLMGMVAHDWRSISLAPRRSLDMGSGVGGIGSWTDYIRHFGVQSERGGQTHSEGDSTARSWRPQGHPPRRRDGL